MREGDELSVCTMQPLERCSLDTEKLALCCPVYGYVNFVTHPKGNKLVSECLFCGFSCLSIYMLETQIARLVSFLGTNFHVVST
jgi:hypothetical protein